MRRTSTTIIGVTATLFGVIGLLIVLLQLRAFLASGDASDDRLFLANRTVAVATKLCLIGAGVSILRRSRLASTLLLLALLFSLADSLAVSLWFLPPVPEGLSAAGRAGRIVGRSAGLWLPPILYLVALAYLARPATRREFAYSDDRNPAVAGR